MFTKNNKFSSIRILVILGLLFGIFGVAPVRASGLTIYVNSSATGANDGSSWTDAYTDLQSAFTAASSGDEIWVAAGTYKPTTDTDRTVSFVLKNGIALYGGFAGTETLLAERDFETNITVLSGEIGVEADNSDNTLHVLLAENLDSPTTVDGFTIQDGNAFEFGFFTERGGGLYSSHSSLILKNLIFSNSSAYEGGGLYNNYSDVSLTDVVIRDNTAFSGWDDGEGGGMGNSFSNLTLTRVIFSNNHAPRSGGGMSIFDSQVTLDDVVFDNNEAGYRGGGIDSSSSNLFLQNVTFSNNKATLDDGSENHWGGGMSVGGTASLTNVTFVNNFSSRGAALYNLGSDLIIQNGTFSKNIATDAGGGILNFEGHSIIRNSIFYNNVGDSIHNKSKSTSTVTYSIVQGGHAGAGNLDVDPLLGPLQDNGGFTQTMALLPGSPAINAANDAKCPVIDQRGIVRPQGSHCDIGAFEYPQLKSVILVAPLSGTLTSTLQPSLDWKDAISDVYQYQIQIAENNKFSSSIVDETNIAVSTFTPPMNLFPGKLYYWRVKTFNSFGDASKWSTVWTFKTPLAQPVMISLTGAEPLLIDRPTFEWSAVDGATSYILQVSAVNNFSTLLVNTTLNTTNYTMTKDLPQNKTLFWRVRAKSPAVSSPWSVKGSFKTGNPPGVPVLVAPTHNALVKNYTPKFDWKNSTIPTGTTFKHYEFQWDDNSGFSSPESATTTLGDRLNSDFTPETSLASNTKFYWRVRAVNTVVNPVTSTEEEHVSGWSPVWSLRTVVSAPTGLTITPGDPNPLRPSFTWDSVTGPGAITGYTIQISTRADFSTLLVNSTTPNPFYGMTKNLPAGKMLYWRVRVNGANGPSIWSPTESFIP